MTTYDYVTGNKPENGQNQQQAEAVRQARGVQDSTSAASATQQSAAQAPAQQASAVQNKAVTPAPAVHQDATSAARQANDDNIDLASNKSTNTQTFINPNTGSQEDVNVTTGHINTMPEQSELERFRDNIRRSRESDASIDAARADANKHKQLTYKDMIRMMYPEMDDAKRKEDEAKLAKRRKRDAIISAVGDGISAIANLVATNRYAPNVNTASDSLSDRSKARYDDIKAKREAKREAYRQAMLKAAMADRQAETAAATAAQEQNNWERTYAFNVAKNAGDQRLAAAKIAADTANKEAQREWQSKENAKKIRSQESIAAAHDATSMGNAIIRANAEGGNGKSSYAIFNPVTGKYDGTKNTGQLLKKAFGYYGNARYTSGKYKGMRILDRLKEVASKDKAYDDSTGEYTTITPSMWEVLQSLDHYGQTAYAVRQRGGQAKPAATNAAQKTNYTHTKNLGY